MATTTLSSATGVLACQRDSYARELQTRVKGWWPLSSTEQKGQGEGVLVEFEDSILFPEGGGQPSDSGTVRVPPRIDSLKMKSIYLFIYFV
jgi:misacylated tRNA(Ala) deacylase